MVSYSIIIEFPQRLYNSLVLSGLLEATLDATPDPVIHRNIRKGTAINHQSKYNSNDWYERKPDDSLVYTHLFFNVPSEHYFSCVVLPADITSQHRGCDIPPWNQGRHWNEKSRNTNLERYATLHETRVTFLVCQQRFG
jgi:hypothetical protein